MQSAWILNCDVKQFDVVKAFENEIIMDQGMTWKVQKQLKKIQINDVFYLYLTSPYQEIMARGRIVELPVKRHCDEISAEFWKNSNKDTMSDRIWIEIDDVLEDKLSITDVNPEGTHDSMKISLGLQGVNHMIPQIAKGRLSTLFSQKTH
jgi:hypothetical protein